VSGVGLGAAALTATAVITAMAPGPLPAARLRGWVDGARHEQRARRSISLAPDGAVPLLGRLGGRLGVRVGGQVGWAVAVPGGMVRRAAGRPADAERDRRLGSALAVGALVVLVAPVLAVPSLVAVYAGAGARARSLEVRRRARLGRDAPDLVELFRLAVGAGLTVGQAVAAVAVRAPSSWAAPLGDVVARVAVGQRLADAIEELGAVDESGRPLSAALVAAERYGVPVGVTLDRLAHDARQQRRRRAEEVARRLPVQMLFPLVLCVLPAFALLTVVPLVVTAVGGLPR